MVNSALTTFVVSRSIAPSYAGRMDSPFIAGRPALDDATDLIDRFGEQAPLEAAARAVKSRNEGNVARFCHWRQIERVIAALSSDEPVGSIH